MLGFLGLEGVLWGCWEFPPGLPISQFELCFLSWAGQVCEGFGWG